MVDPRRAQIFGEDAETYDAARPTYPAGVIDIVTQDAPATAVDVGCGTGKFGRLVAARGVDVLGLEPDPRMAAVARRHGMTVVDGTFEAWEPQPRDLVCSGQAWHWVDAAGGAAKAADVLPAGGRWAACWNREDDPTVRAALATVAGRLAPSLVRERAQRETDHEMAIRIADAFAATGRFGDVEQLTVAWTDNVSVAALVARLSTQSLQRLLERDVAAALDEALTVELGGPDAVMGIEYSTLVLTTTRRD
ncbi:MAG: class I SAM-dependent methyltransferase [Ilumatobacteraceae bacterium]